MVRAVKPKRWVFVLGCYNSGTTLLDHLLGQHPEISNLPSEGVDLTRGLPAPEAFGWPRLWYKCHEEIEVAFQLSCPDPQRITKDWSFWFDRKAPVVVEKSIANSLRIEWLNRNFNNPLFIWIVRNGYCVAEGIRRRSALSASIPAEYHGQGYPIGWCAQQWIENNRLIESKISTMKNVVRLSYEDLVSNPEKSLLNIYSHLPLADPSVPKMEAFTFHGTTMKLRNMNPDSLSRLEGVDISRINGIAEEWLRHYGYNVLDVIKKERNADGF